MTTYANELTTELCGHCAEPLSPEARFCAECGAERSAEAAAPSKPVRRTRAPKPVAEEEAVPAKPAAARRPRATAPKKPAVKAAAKPVPVAGDAEVIDLVEVETTTAVEELPSSAAAVTVRVPAMREPSATEMQPFEADVAAAPAGLPEAPVRPSFLRRRWRLLALVAAVVVALTGVTLLALDDRRTHNRLSDAQAAYNASQVKLHSTESMLSISQSNLATSQAELASLEKELTAKEQELSSVRSNLSDTKDRLNVKASQIETLKSCLSGVSTALSELANGYASYAITALQAVDVSCKAAYALF